MLTKDQVELLRVAVELKQASLERGKKSASPAFRAVYDQEMMAYAVLMNSVRETVDAATAHAKK